MGTLDYVKAGLAVAIVAAIGGLYVLWRSAAADAVSAEAKLTQAEHNVTQLHADLEQAAEASRKLADANEASAGLLVSEQAKNATQAQALQALLASKGVSDAPLASCLARRLPDDVLRAFPR